MNAPTPSTTDLSRAGALRAEFDAGFAAPVPPPPPPLLALLLVSVGGKNVALERAQIGGLARADNLAPAPSRAPAFLGLTAQRGQLHAVWSLGRLLDASNRSTDTERWLVLTAGGQRCALACDAIGQSIAVAASALVAPVRRPGEPGFVRAMVPWASGLLPLIDLVSLQATFRPASASTSSSP